MNTLSARLAVSQTINDGTAPGAAVVGSSIVSFNEGLSPQDREDIYLSNLYAQLATRSAYESGLVGNWFDYYKNKLKFLGWDTTRPVTPAQSRGGQMAGSVSQQLSDSAGDCFSRPASQALAALKRNSTALEVFERTSLIREKGIFQMIPCALKSPGKVEIALYHKQFNTRPRVSKFLFWPIEDVVESSQEQMAIITFSTLHYATFRDKVAAAVVAETTRHLHELEI